ncbi:TIGR01212 family radical SAM protein [Erysipelotrichaceae bacterium OttesenSCG-928-M19]|nr:TIGR01212 family radical SAM protein [Erysipelotrichaceae bacterium OttesenSCG-928-M19]
MRNTMNSFVYSNDNKRYHTFNYYLKEKYQSKVFKVSLNAGFSCPNRDGKVGVGGCTFCSDLGSGDYAGTITKSLEEQYLEVKKMMHQKWPQAKYIVYFQAYTNTYAPLKILKQTYQPFLTKPDVVALAIATRPDCLDNSIIEYLDSLTAQLDVWVELGLQTTHDTIAQSFNRGYDYSVFIDCLKRLQKTKLKVCVHLINGLPNESKAMMIENVKRLNALKIDGIKIHMLHLISDSKMGQDYLHKPFPLLELDEYVALVCEQLRYLDKEIVVQRLTGDADKNNLIAPDWTLNKTNVLNSIDKFLARNNYMQGDLCE